MHQVCLNLREFSSGVQDHQGVGAVGGYGGGAASPHIRPRRGIQLIQRANLRGQECLELSSVLGASASACNPQAPQGRRDKVALLDEHTRSGMAWGIAYHSR